MFVYSFLCELYEWLAKLVDSQRTWKLDNPTVWTPELVRHMEGSENKIVTIVGHWIDSILS